MTQPALYVPEVPASGYMNNSQIWRVRNLVRKDRKRMAMKVAHGRGRMELEP